MPQLLTKCLLHLKKSINPCLRNYSLTKKVNARVLVVGAGGGIGQPLSMLLKLNPLISELRLIDVADIQGVAADLSHVDTSCKVSAYDSTYFDAALKGVNIVVVAAGIPRKPGMSRDDLFKTNADIVGDVMVKIMESKQYPHVAIITNPINSIVPFACKISQMYDPSDQSAKFTKKIYGITCLDSIRAGTFLANHLGKNPADIVVPVIGGHSDTTIVPLFSLSNFPVTDLKVVEDLVKQVREAGTRVVEAKKGAGSATLSMAYAAHRFVYTLIEAYYNKTTSNCAFTYDSNVRSLYCARVCIFDEGCVKDTVPFETMNEYEFEIFDKAMKILTKDIEKGLEYADVYAEDHPPTLKRNDPV